MEKSLDIRLAEMAARSNNEAFILADAKDADMAMGLPATGIGADGKPRSLHAFRDCMRENTAQGLLDIMLISASSYDALRRDGDPFAESPVSPAIRANDTTDIWWARGAAYPAQPSLPFASVDLPEAVADGASLGLYSVTFNNDTVRDRETLSAYGAFRREARELGFRHVLEVFDPNAPVTPIPDLASYMNDNIARALAGIGGKGRPLFLKVAYHGPAAMEALASYDTDLVVGILGGASGTTHDAFYQLWEAKKYGARAALYGRMINNSEDQTTFIQHLRWLADGELGDPAEAVRSYHAALETRGIAPRRALDQDLERTRSFGPESA